jgi:hypothetical protein
MPTPVWIIIALLLVLNVAPLELGLSQNPAAAPRLSAECSGMVSGSAVYLSPESGALASDASNVRLVLCRDGREFHVVADANGDYYGTPLDCGEYTLRRVYSPAGIELKVDGRQHRAFQIRRGHQTRFDVMLLAPGDG